MPDDLQEVEDRVMERMEAYWAEQAALPPEERDSAKKEDGKGMSIAAVVSAAL